VLFKTDVCTHSQKRAEKQNHLGYGFMFVVAVVALGSSGPCCVSREPLCGEIHMASIDAGSFDSVNQSLLRISSAAI
jgi:hypothetical protein